MTDTQRPETIEQRPEGLDLMAAIMAKNASDAAFMSNSVIDSVTRERDDVAAHFAALFDALAELPETIRTVFIENLLDRHGWCRDRVERWINPNAEG